MQREISGGEGEERRKIGGRKERSVRRTDLRDANGRSEKRS